MPVKQPISPGRRRFRQPLWPYLFALPMVLWLLAVFGYPMVKVVQYSFQVVGGKTVRWVGLANYRFILRDPIFWKSLSNNAFLLLAVPILLALSLLFAILLFERIRGWRFYRAVVFLPYVLAPTAVGLAFGYMYQYNGVLNTLLRHLGVAGADWLGKASLVMPSVMSVIIWQQLGFGVVLFLARLMSVPAELYEAARIDGANWWQEHRHITIPQLRLAIEFFAVVEVITMLSWVFNYVYVMTAGGPGFASHVLEYYIYKNAFAFRAMGVASAVAVMLLAVTMVLVVFYFRLRNASQAAEE